MNVYASREPERYAMVWPGVPIGLSMIQARNWWIQHRKPRSYQLERFEYNTKTGLVKTIGYDVCRS